MSFKRIGMNEHRCTGAQKGNGMIDRRVLEFIIRLEPPSPRHAAGTQAAITILDYNSQQGYPCVFSPGQEDCEGGVESGFGAGGVSLE